MKNPPAYVGDIGLIPGLGRSQEGGTATHTSILARIIPWTGGLDGYGPWGHNEPDTTEHESKNTVVHKVS